MTRFHYLLSITLLMLCHPQMHAQVLTKALPGQMPANVFGQPGRGGAENEGKGADQRGPESAAQQPASTAAEQPLPSAQEVPDDPSQQLLPVAKPEPLPITGTPVHWEALEQTQVGDEWTLSGEVVFYYKGYVIHADKVVYHRSTATVEASGHLQVEGGANDTALTADHGEMHLEDHTARFYDVTGSFGVRRVGRAMVYSTADPFLFHGRVLVQTGEGMYHIVDGAMTSCRLPKPDWELISHSIEVANEKATTHNTFFQIFGKIPVFYLPYVQHSLDENGRESGFLLPTGENSGVKGFVIGESVYWAINRSMDMTLGAEYWSKRGFAPYGDFRYKGRGLDALSVRWNALLDRGLEETLSGATTPTLENQGGADILAFGRKDFTSNTRVAGTVEYLSSYIYRLAFDENLATATSSEVQSDLALTSNHRGFIPSVSFDRFQSFAGDTGTDGGPVVSVPEVRILHLPSVRFDAVDRPIGAAFLSTSNVYWGVGASIADLSRAEPHFHARNVGRLDLYPHIDWPIHLGDWDVRPEFALRTTQYSGSQIPVLNGGDFGGVPIVQHDPLNRSDLEFSLDVRPPALERDFTISRWNRTIRHVIEPEVFYHYVTGINNARQTLHFDTTDIATNTNEAGFSLTQRLYLKPLVSKACNAEPESSSINTAASNASIAGSGSPAGDTSQSDFGIHAQAARDDSLGPCQPRAREWASWQIAQKYFIDPTFGGALIPDRRNVFDATLDLTGVSYLTSPRNIAPIISRMRFEAIDNLRIEWDLDYDPKAGRVGADNLFAGYSWGRTTVGLGHSLLNAVDESGSEASVIQSQQVLPFLYFGKPSNVGLSLAMNASWDFTHDQLQYGGVEAIYNWNCCGINVGYRRFELGSLRNEAEWLYGITLSGIGTAGNIRRTTSVFPTADMLNRLY